MTDAIGRGDLDAVVALLRSGADVNAADGPHSPPLHQAIEHQRVEIVRCLIAAGAAVNRDFGKGWTPLVHAIDSDSESDAASQAGTPPEAVSTELLELLLAAGAKPTERAFELAAAYRNHKAQALLQAARHRMVILPETATDKEIIEAVDGWVSLLEKKAYEAACASVDSVGWVLTAQLLRSLIEDGWDDAPTKHRVTLAGVPRPTAIDGFVATQRKDVHRHEPNDGGEVIDIWYDLNIDGVVSDLTATFRLVRVPHGLMLRFYDICVR
jgi:hypothetical protein